MYGTHNAPEHRNALVLNCLDDVEIEKIIRVSNDIGVKLSYGCLVNAESISNTRRTHFFFETPLNEQLLFFI